MAIDTIKSTAVLDGAIATADIADDAVTADKLANAINTSIAAKSPLASPAFTGNVGINEASPLGNLHVKSGESGATVDGSANELVVEGSGNSGISILSGSSSGGQIYFGDSELNYDGYLAYSHASRNMTLGTAGAGRLNINSAGNVGVGVTPEASGSNYNVLQIGQGGSLMAPTATEDMYVGSNVYRNSSNTNSYIVTEKASIYEQYNGEHYFNVAPSGSADAAISFAQGMKISNAGIATKPYQPAFDAYSHQNAYSSGTSIASTNLSSTRFNTGNHYSTSGLRFVAPVAGVYRFNYRTIINGATNNAHLRMFKNGSIISGSDFHYSASTGTAWGGWTYSILVQLSVNDYVQVTHTSNESIHGMNYQSFNGYLIG